MGYNGGHWALGSRKYSSRRGYKGFPKSGERAWKGLTTGKYGLITTLSKSTKKSSLSSKSNISGNYYSGYNIRAGDRSGGILGLGNDLVGPFIFLLLIGIILLVLGLADIWWFGFCYFFGVVPLALAVLFTLEPLFSANKSNIKHIWIIGILLIILGLLPFNIYGDNPIIWLDVETLPQLIILEAILLIGGGLFLLGCCVRICRYRTEGIDNRQAGKYLKAA